MVSELLAPISLSYLPTDHLVAIAPNYPEREATTSYLNLTSPVYNSGLFQQQPLLVTPTTTANSSKCSVL